MCLRDYVKADRKMIGMPVTVKYINFNVQTMISMKSLGGEKCQYIHFNRSIFRIYRCL